jgi:hypothetical protein
VVPAGGVGGLEQEGLHIELRDNKLRLSPHLYNMAEDIDRAIGLLAETAVGAGSRLRYLFHRSYERVTGLPTATARVGTNAAVLVLACVALAFLDARCAYFPARLQQGLGSGSVVLRLARENATGCLAYVCTVKIQSDALAEFGDALFGETCVRAAGA